jgi:hypothetical protein
MTTTPGVSNLDLRDVYIVLEELPCPACGERPFSHPRWQCGIEEPFDVVCAYYAFRGWELLFTPKEIEELSL